MWKKKFSMRYYNCEYFILQKKCFGFLLIVDQLKIKITILILVINICNDFETEENTEKQKFDS